MADKRNRILELVNYIKTFGIEVNIAKNKARGNKGIFCAKKDFCRIDISNILDESEKLSVLVHEFVHYIHYKYDVKLKSLKFLFGDNIDDYIEDLIYITVASISKKSIEPLFRERNLLKEKSTNLKNFIKNEFNDIKISDKKNSLLKEISHCDYRYLLKHDRVKVFSMFNTKIYSIENIEKDFPNIKPSHVAYIKFLSLKRKLNKINSRISKYNRYYNSPAELLAKSFEYYILKKDTMKNYAPDLYEYYNEVISANRIPMLSKLAEILGTTPKNVIN